MSQENLFGFVSDKDESLVSEGGSNLKFGLNQGATITSKELATESEDSGAYVQFNFNVGGADINIRYWNPTKVYKGGNLITDTNSSEYKEAYTKELKQAMASIIHVVKSTKVSEERIQKAIKDASPTDFVSWAEAVLGTMSEEGMAEPKDLFLEYQWNIGKTANRTYLQVPKNMKGSSFIVPEMTPKGGDWKEEREWTTKDGKKLSGLRYVDGDGNVHEFTRNSSFMTSNKAIQQFEDAADGSEIESSSSESAASIWGS